MIQNIHYLVGPNGTGKTRALDRLCTQHGGFFIPKQRPTPNVNQFDEGSTKEYIQRFQRHSKNSPEQVAMALLREKSKLRYTVFSILSRKLGRNFSVEIVERSQHFKITSGLNDDSFEEVTIQRYGLEGESSGLRELLVLLTLIHSELSKKYFIDEPELSLHPEAQRFLKNEMLRLADKGYEFWLATHSPIFFSPESIDELKQATFFSDPQKAEGTKPAFDSYSEGQKKHLEKSLLRLDTEKWLLVHSRAVVFCEGFRDKVIFKTVLNKANIDLSRHDFSLVETGGKEDFSTLFLLCQAIDKPAFFIGDLDCLIDCQLLDKYDNNETMKKELEGISTTFLEYVSHNVRAPLGLLTEELLKINDTDFQTRDTSSIILKHILRIKEKTDNSKSLTLELINAHPALIKTIIANSSFDSKVDLLVTSTKKSIAILQRVGVFLVPHGSLETYYKSKPVSPDKDKDKIRLFDEELNIINTDSPEDSKVRYKTLIDFINSVISDTFDNKKFMREEMIKVLSKIQAIVLDEKPASVTNLTTNPKYISLKVSDLIEFSNISWTSGHFELKGKSVDDFVPPFNFILSSDKGITSTDTLKFDE